MNADRKKRRIPAPVLARIGLALAALLACVIGYMGFRALDEQSASGFRLEGTFGAVSAMSGETEAAWKALEPSLDALPGAERDALEEICAERLGAVWEMLLGEGAGEEARSMAKDPERTWKLLYATYTPYLANGKLKLVKTARNAILSAGDPSAFRERLLRCLADASEPVPEEIEKAASGDGRQDALIQAVFVTLGSERAAASEAATALRKELASSEAPLETKIGILSAVAKRESSPAWQAVVNHAKTVILISVLLLLDAALLFLLMAQEKRGVPDLKHILILLIADLLIYLLLMPMVYMILQAFTENGTFTLERFRRLFENPDNRTALRNTLIAAAATMALGTLIAFPLAWLVGRTNLYGRRFFRSLFVLTYMVPPYVGAMAWQQLLNPNVGMINRWLRALLGLSGPGPLNIYTLPGLVWALTTFYYPYAFITISRAMEKMDPSLEEAGRVSGASPLKTLLTVTFPMMTPSLIAGALLVFISAASCYGIPSIIASGTTGMRTVTTRIAEIHASGGQNLNDATGLSVILILIALAILFISDFFLARKRYTTVSGKSVRPSIVDLRGWRVPLTVLTALFAGIVVFLPFETVLVISLKSDMGRSLLARGNFTLANWKTVFRSGETLASMRNSLLFAAMAATVGIVIACVTSHLLQRTKIRGRSIPSFLISLGSGTPSVVIALGLIMTMDGSFGLRLVGTASVIVAAYMVKYLMMGVRTVASSMSQIHASLEESSQISGAGWFGTMRRITGPLILPSIAAGWFLIFIPCFYELTMTVLLFSASTKTIGVQLYDYWTIHSKPVGCAMAFGILLAVAAFNFILDRLTRGKFSI